MTGKRYYWLKLKKDFFKRHDIKIIENMPNGKDYVLFYLKLLLESIDHEGNLRFSDTIPYNEQMLATVTDTNVDIVKSALNIFRELGLVEIFDDHTLYMVEVEKMTGSETAWAAKKREYKKRNDELKEEKVGKISQQSPDNFQTISDKSKSKSKSKSIELEKELELEIEKEKDIKESDTNVSLKKSRIFKPPTVEEVEKYCFEKNYNVDAEHFVDFYTANGWVQGKGKPIKDWKACVRTWAYNSNHKSTSNSNNNVNSSRQSQLDYLLNSIREDEMNDGN